MQMKRKRRAFSEKFKAKVAIEAIKGIKTISQLATEYKVHPNQISTWKKQLLQNAEELFATGRKQKSKTEEELTAPLYEEIGRLKMDIKWLEKKLRACLWQPGKVGWNGIPDIPSDGNADWQAFQGPIYTMNLLVRQRQISLSCD